MRSHLRLNSHWCSFVHTRANMSPNAKRTKEEHRIMPCNACSRMQHSYSIMISNANEYSRVPHSNSYNYQQPSKPIRNKRPCIVARRNCLSNCTPEYQQGHEKCTLRQ